MPKKHAPIARNRSAQTASTPPAARAGKTHAPDPVTFDEQELLAQAASYLVEKYHLNPHRALQDRPGLTGKLRELAFKAAHSPGTGRGELWHFVPAVTLTDAQWEARDPGPDDPVFNAQAKQPAPQPRPQQLVDDEDTTCPLG